MIRYKTEKMIKDKKYESFCIILFINVLLHQNISLIYRIQISVNDHMQ